MHEGKTGRDITVGARPVSHRVVSGAVALGPDDEHVIAVIPASSDDDYDITLPPLSARPGQEIYISCRGGGGTGGVQLKDRSDGIKAAGLTNDKMTDPATDFWHVRNVLGLFWLQIAETTT